MDKNIMKLNIQPNAGIMNVFSRLSYKPWYAIAEFVDNSTQSYYNNKKELKSSEKDFKLVVKIQYDDENKTLRINDNAYGMEFEDFKSAIILDSKNNRQRGRNEFGMGLKTAASWFGNRWSVRSTQLGSENEYYAQVDINYLKSSNANEIDIIKNGISQETHGTEIIIEQVTKQLSGPRTISKIKELLASMYRRDINSDNVSIIFNEEPIQFQEINVLKFREKEWKKPLDFVVNFREKEYRVTGFVGIMQDGSFPKAGFALFRNNRVVIGGSDMNYKPNEIFGQAQSQISLKLFGELDMNSFPINQAKDGFIWYNGLEDEFVAKLRENITDYITIADMSKKARQEEEEFSSEKSIKVQEETANILKNLEYENTTERENIDNYDKEKGFEGLSNNDISAFQKTFMKLSEKTKDVGTSRPYKFKIDRFREISVNVKWSIGQQNFWIDVGGDKDNLEVTINIDHPFFKPYSKQEDFKGVLERLVLAFVIAEKESEFSSDKDGYVLPSTIRVHINEILNKMSKE